MMKLLGIIVGGLLAAGLSARGDSPAPLVHYNAQPTGSKVTMDGTSTIHDWTVTSPIIGGSIQAAPGFPESALTSEADAKPVVQAFIPIRTLKSHAKRMDDVMDEHLKMAEFPKIEYRIIELKPKSPAGTTGKIEFEATGTLTVSGVTVTNVMPVTIEKLDGGKLKVSGATPLKMTDFKVEPPAPSIMGMPLIKTGNEIKIKFEWLLAPKQ